MCYFLVITLLDKELIKYLDLVSSLVFAFEIWRGQIYLKVDTAAAIIVHIPLAILHYGFCILLSKLLLHLSHRLEPFWATICSHHWPLYWVHLYNYCNSIHLGIQTWSEQQVRIFQKLLGSRTKVAYVYSFPRWLIKSEMTVETCSGPFYCQKSLQLHSCHTHVATAIVTLTTPVLLGNCQCGNGEWSEWCAHQRHLWTINMC